MVVRRSLNAPFGLLQRFATPQCGVLVHELSDAFYGASTGSGVGQPFILLNQPMTPFLRHAWATSPLRVCADGGANRLYDSVDSVERTSLRPHFICGDLDSIRPEVLAHYEGLGTIVASSPDQDTNDLDKAIALVRERGAAADVARGVIVDGGLGGRLDHTLCNINGILLAADVPLRLCSPLCVCFVLPPGSHRVVRNPRHETIRCGIIPLTGLTEGVTSQGLRWELNGVRLGFGALLSTSNEFKADAAHVDITTDVPLLWTNVLRTDAEV